MLPSRSSPSPALRFVQIEVTTHCNFTCFYCAGRAMPQRHMPLALFDDILRRLPPRALTVSLQGEGEPMLHPEFWEMVTRVRARGHRPYTITNGSALPYPEHVAEAFPEIGISIDSLNETEAERIGRTHLDRVLRNLDRLLESMPASRVTVHTVDVGQPLDALREFVAARGMRHLIQPLQRKEDYRQSYATAIPATDHGRTGPCHYLRQPRMKYFNIDGVEMPCCFIKDTSAYRGVPALHDDFAARRVPECCRGCQALT
jgi:MoaA/NifB/PqqE/SkfB family radical SAM enzyme